MKKNSCLSNNFRISSWKLEVDSLNNVCYWRSWWHNKILSSIYPF